jgi:hypothetical protein
MYACCRNTVSTLKKSTARIPDARARRKLVQDCPDRRGAGSTPAARRIAPHPRPRHQVPQTD